MKVMTMRGLILLASLALYCAPALPQSSPQSGQQPSNQPAATTPSTTNPAEVPLGDAARKAKLQKESQGQSAKTAPKTWNNDNIPKTGQINVIGAPAPEQPASADQSSDNGKQSQNAQMSDQEKARAQQQLADAQAKLEDLKKDADIAERRLKLDSDMYYGKPEYSNDTAGKAALDSETADVNNKKAAVAAKEKEIQDLSKKLGAPAMPTAAPDKNQPANNNSISNNTTPPSNTTSPGTSGISLTSH